MGSDIAHDEGEGFANAGEWREAREAFWRQVADFVREEAADPDWQLRPHEPVVIEWSGSWSDRSGCSRDTRIRRYATRSPGEMSGRGIVRSLSGRWPTLQGDRSATIMPSPVLGDGRLVAVGLDTNLDLLLANMSPRQRPGEYVFVVDNATSVPDRAVLASVVEPEGRSIVLTRQEADNAGLSYDFVAGWITLDVRSALEAVGLTAAVAGALCETGISCNVVAGYHHDHLLVPHERVDDAIHVLMQLMVATAGRAAAPTEGGQAIG